MSVEVVSGGVLTTLQDRGRRGLAALGVGNAGPMDPVSFRLANALVGNAQDACALEMTLRGPRLRFESPAVIAVAGGEFALRLDGTDMPAWRPLQVAAGTVLDGGSARRGARAYLAVAGGFDVARVLGSAATDLNAGLGPFGGRALRDGDRLSIRAAAEDRNEGAAEKSSLYPARSRARPDWPNAQVPARQADAAAPRRGTRRPWAVDPRPWFDADASHAVHLIAGPDFDALTEVARAALFAQDFRIAPDSNRVGFRLEGADLALAGRPERISEPVAFGCMQLPPSGQPIVLMAEHPTTGGYPCIGQVAAIDLPRLAQRRPGDRVRFRPIDLDDAQTRYLRRERELALLIGALTRRLALDD